MNLIYSAIEKYFPLLVRNKKMALAWALFISAIGWMLFFIPSYPAENAKFANFLVEMNSSDADYQNSLVVYDIVSPQILEAIQVRIYFLENFSDKYPYDTVKPEVIAKGYKQVTDVLSGTASARGVINGVNFIAQDLNKYKEGFAQDLTLMETYLKDYESFYLALIRGDAKEALNISANFKSSSATESISGFYVRLGNFSKEAGLEMDKQSVAI
ncbi:MAG: hypothetical protein QM730_04005 [Anaerolineales bacterium]